MKRFSIAAALAVFLVMSTMSGPAAAHEFYGKSAKKAAAKIDCKKFKSDEGGPEGSSAGTCKLDGVRLYLITFESKSDQRQFNKGFATQFTTDQRWANGRGAVAAREDGKSKGVKVALKRMPGKWKYGTLSE